MRDYIHLQHRAKRDLFGLILGRVIDRDLDLLARRYVWTRNRYNTVLRFQVFGFGILYIHAKHLPGIDRLRRAGL